MAAATITTMPDAEWLDDLYARYHDRRFIHDDPLGFLHDYPDLADREIVGLIASSLAYGNVKAMRPAIRSVLDALGSAPAAALHALPDRAILARFRSFRYRVTPGAKLAGLLIAVKRVRTASGSLDDCLAMHLSADDDTILPGLAGLIDAMHDAAPCPLDHLLPHPARGSACKRLLLYLRWMIRCDAVDPGGWRSAHTRQLIMPIDTHVHRAALERGWTRRATADLKTAIEVTGHLRAIAPDDPLRYDFAITRPGIRREAEGGLMPSSGPIPSENPRSVILMR
jgi:uncharacterized protein (TIGR02757 family)